MEKYKFQSLEVYQLALAYIKAVYSLSRQLPANEKFNLAGQIERAAVSIALNIAEGSTGQSDPEQNRFLSLALRSYLEMVACLDIIEQFEYIPEDEISALRQQGHPFFIKLSAFRKALS